MDVARAKTHDPERWLENAPELSRPLVQQVREWIHRWEPDLTEAIKWNMLCFSGRKLVCALSACKKHMGISFFRGTEIDDPQGLFTPSELSTHIMTIRATTLEGFKTQALRQILHAAIHLDQSPKMPPPPKVKREEWPMPEALANALKKNKRAAAFFDQLKPTYQREYKVWISTAKRDDTRDERLKQTLAALCAGKKWAQRKDV